MNNGNWIIILGIIVIGAIFGVCMYLKHENDIAINQTLDVNWTIEKWDYLKPIPISIEERSPNGTQYSCAELDQLYGDAITFCDDSLYGHNISIIRRRSTLP
jgi:hypothetical protein